jgi:hypothetical protein
MVRGPAGLDRGLEKKVLAGQASVAIVALRVEDPQLRPPARRAEPVARDHHLRPLSDHVPTEADPRSPCKLQSQTGRFGHGRPEPGPQAGWLEEDEEGVRPSGEGSEAMKPVADTGRTSRPTQPRRQIHDEKIDRPSGEQRGRDRQSLVEAVRSDDDQPLEPNAAADGLDRVEAAPDVHPGGDRSGRLRLRHGPQGERRLAARAGAAQGHAGGTRQPARTQDPVQRREAGRDDPSRGRESRILDVIKRQGGRGERPDDLPDGTPGSCRPPPRLEGRERRRHVRGEGRHRHSSIEHLFDIVND